MCIWKYISLILEGGGLCQASWCSVFTTIFFLGITLGGLGGQLYKDWESKLTPYKAITLATILTHEPSMSNSIHMIDHECCQGKEKKRQFNT